MRLKKDKILLLFFIFFIFSVPVFSQDVDAHSPRTNGGSVQQRNADKKKAKTQRKIEKGNEKARKQHLKLQTKNTKKMMRESRRKAKKWNSKGK